MRPSAHITLLKFLYPPTQEHISLLKLLELVVASLQDEQVWTVKQDKNLGGSSVRRLMVFPIAFSPDVPFTWNGRGGY